MNNLQFLILNQEMKNLQFMILNQEMKNLQFLILNQDVTNESNPFQSQVTFEVVEEGTKRRKSKLIDSKGYTYNVKMRRADVTYWQCTVRPKFGCYNASVTQREEIFQLGKHNHNHQPAIDSANTAKIKTVVKKKAMENMFKPASAIVDEVMHPLLYLILTCNRDRNSIKKPGGSPNSKVG